MNENGFIIKTRKLSPREVKKKLRDFIDEISEDCGPDMEQMADELKAHGDAFIDSLSGNGQGYNRGGNSGGGYMRDGSSTGYGGGFSRGGRAWHRNEGTPEEREELRRKNERKLQEMERMMQELKQQMMQDM